MWNEKQNRSPLSVRKDSDNLRSFFSLEPADTAFLHLVGKECRRGTYHSWKRGDHHGRICETGTNSV